MNISNESYNNTVLLNFMKISHFQEKLFFANFSSITKLFECKILPNIIIF